MEVVSVNKHKYYTNITEILWEKEISYTTVRLYRFRCIGASSGKVIDQEYWVVGIPESKRYKRESSIIKILQKNGLIEEKEW